MNDSTIQIKFRSLNLGKFQIMNATTSGSEQNAEGRNTTMDESKFFYTC
jgi:hypothetical protein